ncbi:hypothetical protein [Promicromonospora iranensis]|uniref:SOS-response transcriptional repressor LexA n=1 Tax=Promicromonospora iranensis TaxID=1105144 RepID=A0ABU2CUT0_9MICO|nr:hypothetical protein [Promicromonospora iranensis]MDR7385110.1 SOS-response transcriptional repressor LexA [Promicromonospora iranensis]
MRDLTKMRVHDRAATFIVHAAGDFRTGAGMSDGDGLLVDQSKPARR